MRGVTHRPIGGEVAELHVADLAKIRHEGAVTLVTLKKDRLISRTATRVKILDGGEVTKSFVLQGVTASVAARKKIEAAGGRLESGNA
jgi:ribosomal protein L15